MRCFISGVSLSLLCISGGNVKSKKPVGKNDLMKDQTDLVLVGSLPSIRVIFLQKVVCTLRPHFVFLLSDVREDEENGERVKSVEDQV